MYVWTDTKETEVPRYIFKCWSLVCIKCCAAIAAMFSHLVYSNDV